MLRLFLVTVVITFATASWDAQIQDLLSQTKGRDGHKNGDKAAIIGLDGSKWTTDGATNGLKLSELEAANIANAFKSNDFTSMQAHGIIVEGVKYNFLREDDGVVLGKMKGFGSITLQKTKTAIVIGHTCEGDTQGNTNKGVAVEAGYLESLNMSESDVGISGMMPSSDLLNKIFMITSVFGSAFVGYHLGQKNGEAKYVIMNE